MREYKIELQFKYIDSSIARFYIIRNYFRRTRIIYKANTKLHTSLEMFDAYKSWEKVSI